MLFLLLSFVLVAHLQSTHAIPIDNSLVDAEMVKECVSNKSVDLLLIMDASASIGEETFELQKKFAVMLARRLNVSAETNHMAVSQYSDRPQLELSLTQYSTTSQVEWAIQRIPYLSGATNTGAALQLALERGFAGARGGDVPKVVVLISDGQSQDNVIEASTRLRDADVLIYAIGVSNLVNVHELHQIAGNPNRVLTVETFDQLDETLANSLTWEMCKTEFRPGTPDVICAPDHIGVRAATRKPFDGFVFVMDHFHQPECRAGPNRFSDAKSIGITVPFTDCNVHRYRSLNPRGIFVEMSVVFMFHTQFMTKVDQMVRIQCFYMEADKTVTVPMEVSMMVTEFREKMYPMPICEYSLRRGAVDGPVVGFAQIGESIFHRWECKEQTKHDTFGMLVHSCFVDDRYGNRVDILDKNGCGIDAVLLSTPDYDTSLRLVHRAYHVFKYADRPVLQFQCQVTLCLKQNGGCEGVTPPKCPLTLSHHHHHSHEHNSSSQRDNSTDLHRPKRRISTVSDFDSQQYTMDVFTKPLLIVDQDVEINTNIPCLIASSRSTIEENFVWLAAVISTVTLLNMAMLITTFAVCRRSRRRRTIGSSTS